MPLQYVSDTSSYDRSLERDVTRVLDDTGCTLLQEPVHLFGAHTQTWPADVAVLDYTESNLAIDVSCTRIMTGARLSKAATESGTALAEAETRKRATYAAALAATPGVHRG